MTDHITLPRSVGERLRKAMLVWRHLPYFSPQEDETALAALDAALAEPTAKPEPVVVEQLFVLAKLTVRRAADPDPWVWDRLDDDGTWKPFNPLIHGPDMWRLEQALRAALAEPDATREPATDKEIDAEWLKIKPVLYPMYGLGDFRDGFRAAERFHGIVREDK